MAKPDFLHVIAPVNTDGSFQFWEPVRTGKLPREGKCEGEEFSHSFTFMLGYSWEMQRKIESVLGYIPPYGWYNLRTRQIFETEFLLAVPLVMERRGFKAGPLTAIGSARRPSKGAWDFTFKGVNIQIPENFILAKLMDKEEFESEIWVQAVRATFPNLLKNAA